MKQKGEDSGRRHDAVKDTFRSRTLECTCSGTQKQRIGSAMSLSVTSGVTLLGFCDSGRVTHTPRVVVIGLLCVDAAVAFRVPQGSGSVSGCGRNRCYGSRIKSERGGKKQNNNSCT